MCDRKCEFFYFTTFLALAQRFPHGLVFGKEKSRSCQALTTAPDVLSFWVLIKAFFGYCAKIHLIHSETRQQTEYERKTLLLRSIGS
jgi:hypothetical protein